MVGLAALQLTHRNDSAIGYFKTEQPYPVHLLYTIIYLNVKILFLKLKNQNKYKLKQSLN
ncbi:hypothetical protein VCHA40P242_30151 [Vibrio chagasii]|nr:hypothetical protein VCHA36P164_20151 [Vibrio chagasii]CAH7214863.1 hypothetical protein VCHA40P242_30151 [Vibrio chagasii]